MRSVHTLASVQSHCGGTSLPCLACGTPGSLNCDCVSFTLPPSCPPWLHGHYPLHRYYGDSDSCPAPSSTRTGLLDYGTCACGHSVSNHPMRPRSQAILLVPGGLGLRLALHRYQRFFGLRSLQAVSSVASGRIEFVSRASSARQLYGLSFRFQLLSTPRRRDAVTFNSWREAPPQRDFHPPVHVLSQAHRCLASRQTHLCPEVRRETPRPATGSASALLRRDKTVALPGPSDAPILRFLCFFAAFFRSRFRPSVPLFTSAFFLHNSAFASALWHKRRNLYRPWWHLFLSYEIPVNMGQKAKRSRAALKHGPQRGPGNFRP